MAYAAAQSKTPGVISGLSRPLYKSQLEKVKWDADKPDLCNEFHSAGLSLRPLESSCWNIRQETAGTLIDAAKYLQTINRPRRVDPHKTTKLILNTRE